MSLQELKNLPIKNITKDNAVLFLWVTYPFLPEGLELIKAWGFTYKSIAFQWLKLNKVNKQPFYGLGRWTRGNTEPCLLATKGKPKRICPAVFQLIQAPIIRHSQKPGEARDKIIQLMGPLPRIELFARQKIEGWDIWGNELENSIDLMQLKNETSI